MYFNLFCCLTTYKLHLKTGELLGKTQSALCHLQAPNLFAVEILLWSEVGFHMENNNFFLMLLSQPVGPGLEEPLSNAIWCS